jgi:NAD(P)-dependent dehydrogenase (short-subunit alcohol dehydrogenase family)
MGHYLVTGVTGGIGRSLASRLYELGHTVTGICRPRSDAAAGPVLGVSEMLHVDLADPASLAAALAPFLDALSTLDGIVHCAGIVKPGVLADSVTADFTDQFAVNVIAVAELSRLCLAALVAARGTVVLINSGSGLNARTPLGSYGASKYALRAYADVLRAEQPLLRVCSVYPGPSATAMQRQVREAEGGAYVEGDYVRPSTVAEVICTALLLPPDAVITDVTVRPVGAQPTRSPDAHQ